MQLNRRHLLLSGLSLPLASYAQTPSGNPPRWIVLLLRGAIDGLSVCAPYSERAYRDDRPSIALPVPGQEGGLIDLDGHFGLHPALSSLQPLWTAGQLGFVQACGQARAGRSHFEAQDELESGTPGVKSTGDGWLNRLLQLQAGPPDTVRAVYSGAMRPKLLGGAAGAAVAALPGGAAGRGTNREARNARRAGPAPDGLGALYEQDPRYAKAWQDAQRGREQMAGALQTGSMQEPAMLDREMQAASNGAPPPGSFPDAARRLAQVMRADRNLQFACLEIGGWDTHARQGASQGQLAGKLAPLGQGLVQLARELGPIWNDTVVTVVSEFGRTVRENGTGGTDHGHGNALWLLGGRIAGGQVHGRWPTLDASARFEGRDLEITTDYRAVMAGVAAQHLRLKDGALAQVFPGFSGAPVQVMRA